MGGHAAQEGEPRRPAWARAARGGRAQMHSLAQPGSEASPAMVSSSSSLILICSLILISSSQSPGIGGRGRASRRLWGLAGGGGGGVGGQPSWTCPGGRGRSGRSVEAHRDEGQALGPRPGLWGPRATAFNHSKSCFCGSREAAVGRPGKEGDGRGWPLAHCGAIFDKYKI